MKSQKRSGPTTSGTVTVNSLSDSTLIDRRTIKKRLKQAGVFPLADGSFEVTAALAAIQPPAPDEGSSTKEKKLFEEWRKLKIVNDKRDALLVEKSKVKESIMKFNTRVDAICSRYENEWPSVLAGLEPPAIRAYLKRGFDQVRAEIGESYGVWTCLLFFLFCVSVNAQPVEFYNAGLGVPVNDHQLLTVAHLGERAGLTTLHDSASDLMLVNYSPGTFAAWAVINFEEVQRGDELRVAIQRRGEIVFAVQTVQDIFAGRYIRTEPLYQFGDSGGGMFNGAGQLVGVNYGTTPRNSYGIWAGGSEDWLRCNIDAPTIPEPGTVALLSAALCLVLLNRKRK